MSGTSNVGGRGVYEAGDQRNPPSDEVNKRDRYEEGAPNSHNPLDSSMCLLPIKSALEYQISCPQVIWLPLVLDTN